MGGHGGLNILPQKKWNVYNHDNRAIVQKDKKQAEEKKKSQYQKDRQKQLDGKLEVLRQEAGIPAEKKQQKPQPFITSLNEQFKRINQKSHINLFEKEQKIIENRQFMEIKRLRQAQFLKDKNMDYSSKFMGIYAEGNKMSPWYSKEKGHTQQKKKLSSVQSLLSVKKSDSHTLNQVIKIEKKSHYQKARERPEERQRSREKKNKNEEKSQIEILRQKRKRRQQRQRQKAEKLKLSRRDS